MRKAFKKFWLTPKQYPNASTFTRLEVVKYQSIALVALAACIWGLVWAINTLSWLIVDLNRAFN
jgi:hypothetical protein